MQNADVVGTGLSVRLLPLHMRGLTPGSCVFAPLGPLAAGLAVRAVDIFNK